MWKNVIGSLVFLLILIYAFGFTRWAHIETEIAIKAPPETVWATLTDFPAYPNWNPFIQKIEGTGAVGEKLTAEMHPLHMESAQTFSPKLLVVEPNKELRWLGKLGIPAIFDGEHYFEIEATETGSRLVNGERFRGLLLLAIDPEEFISSFEAANEAMKMQIEAAN